jgi:hypothetical protein
MHHIRKSGVEVGVALLRLSRSRAHAPVRRLEITVQLVHYTPNNIGD